MTSMKKRLARRAKRMCPAPEVVPELLEYLGGKEQRHLTALWSHWAMVMGEEMAGLGFPLGHRQGTLTIGADDAMAMQELSLRSDEILERVNAFMDSPFFTRVKVELTRGRRDLARKRPMPEAAPGPAPLPPRPERLGSLKGKLDPDSPVTRCYEAYLALYGDA